MTLYEIAMKRHDPYVGISDTRMVHELGRRLVRGRPVAACGKIPIWHTQRGDETWHIVPARFIDPALPLCSVCWQPDPTSPRAKRIPVNQARDAAITVLATHTNLRYEQIGEWFDLSRNRIQQIAVSGGAPRRNRKRV